MYHACGQKVELEEYHNGYCAWYLTRVNGGAVRYCPRCGKRIRVEALIHPKNMPARGDADWLEYLDQQDTIASLQPIL